jgi:multicomponent Na+:H+ antiporter subunit B
MIYVLLVFWIVSAVLAIKAQRLVRIIVYLAIFSTISAVCFFVLGAPDVAMAEVAVSSFSTVFLIVCFEKYFTLVSEVTPEAPAQRRFWARVRKFLFPVCFTAALTALFIYFIPEGAASTYLKDLYLAGFQSDVGGENAVTSIYLGYRMYDTLFEALMLLISVVGVAHMSWHSDSEITDQQFSGVTKSDAVDVYTIRILCPAMLIFGVYLILNGHISPGGGFQGGVAVASFFICRYLIHNAYDVRFGMIMIMEKMTFSAIAILAAFFIFLGFYANFPQLSGVYLIMMNLLIAMKVACGFIIIFYRYIAFERR